MRKRTLGVALVVVVVSALAVAATVSAGKSPSSTNQNTAVNILDLQAVKNQLGVPVDFINYNDDVTVNGVINILDLQAVKNNLNQAQPTCP